MGNIFRGALAIIGTVLVIIGIAFTLGWTDVFYTSTVGKAKQNAQREVFEESQSYVEGKRQEAAKLYKEYMQAEHQVDKNVINNVVRASFANFDENKYLDEPLRTFIYNAKYYYGNKE